MTHATPIREVRLVPYEDSADQTATVAIPVGATRPELVRALRGTFWQLRLTELVTAELRALRAACESDPEFHEGLARLMATGPGRRALEIALEAYRDPYDRAKLTQEKEIP